MKPGIYENETLVLSIFISQQLVSVPRRWRAWSCPQRCRRSRGRGRPGRRGPSGRLGRRGGGGGRGARPVHAREPFSSLRAESGAARRYTCISQPSGRSGTSYCPQRQNWSPSGHSRLKEVTALYASLIDVQLRPRPFIPRPSPATEKRRHFSPRPFARSTSG